VVNLSFKIFSTLSPFLDKVKSEGYGEGNKTYVMESDNKNIKIIEIDVLKYIPTFKWWYWIIILLLIIGGEYLKENF
jgi:hypothetical protein